MSSTVVRSYIWSEKIHYQNIPQAPLKIFNRGFFVSGVRRFEVHSCEIMTRINQCKSLKPPALNLYCGAEKPGSFAVRY